VSSDTEFGVIDIPVERYCRLASLHCTVETNQQVQESGLSTVLGGNLKKEEKITRAAYQGYVECDEREL